MKKYVVLAAVAVIAFTGCKEKEKNIIGTWRVTGAQLDPPVTYNGTTYSDVYSLMFDQPCEQDNLYMFQEDGVVLEDEGASKCSPNDSQSSTATYKIEDDKLTIYSDDTTTFSNLSIDDGVMKGTIENQDFFGSQTNITITWTQQD